MDERRAHGKEGGVVEVVFLTAMVVRKGESMTDCLERWEGTRENGALIVDVSLLFLVSLLSSLKHIW